MAEAAHAAGVSHRTGQKYETHAEIQAAYRQLMQEAIPAEKLVNLIKGGCTARMPVFSPEGKILTHRPDWKTRRGYIEMAAKHSGYHEEKAVVQSGITFVVNHIGQSSSTPRVIEARVKDDRSD